MRSKEYAHDYRYFPEPDLVPLVLDPAFVAESQAALPELPRARYLRFVDAYRLPAYDAAILTQSKALADYYEAAASEAGNAKAVSNWIMSELLREIGSDDESALTACPVTPAHLGHLVKLIDGGTISGNIAKDVFEKMLRSGDAPGAIVAREGLTQMADTGQLEGVIDQVLASNPKPLEDWKKGKTAAAQALFGLVMRATEGKANPSIVKRLLEAKLPKI